MPQTANRSGNGHDHTPRDPAVKNSNKIHQAVPQGLLCRPASAARTKLDLFFPLSDPTSVQSRKTGRCHRPRTDLVTDMTTPRDPAVKNSNKIHQAVPQWLPYRSASTARTKLDSFSTFGSHFGPISHPADATDREPIW